VFTCQLADCCESAAPKDILCRTSDGRYLLVTFDESNRATVYYDGQRVTPTEFATTQSPSDPWMWIEFGDHFTYVSGAASTFDKQPLSVLDTNEYDISIDEEAGAVTVTMK
jgi:hypothetical protein